MERYPVALQTLDILRFRERLDQKGEDRQRISYVELLSMCQER